MNKLDWLEIENEQLRKENKLLRTKLDKFEHIMQFLSNGAGYVEWLINKLKEN